MPLGNYGELKTSVADWLARDDLTTRIPDFIALFEASARREFGGKVLAAKSTITTTPDSATVTLAVDPQSITYLGHLDGTDLVQTGAQDLTRMGTQMGKPIVWTWDSNSVIRFFPTPDAEYTLTMFYNQNLTGLSTDGESNYLLANYPDVYLYGTLLQARQFLQDEALQVYEQKYAMLAESLKLALSCAENSSGLNTCWSRGAPV